MAEPDLFSPLLRLPVPELDDFPFIDARAIDATARRMPWAAIQTTGKRRLSGDYCTRYLTGAPQLTEKPSGRRTHWRMPSGC